MNEYIKAIQEVAEGNFKALQILNDMMGRNNSLKMYGWLKKEGLTGSKLVEYMEEHKINSMELADKIRFQIFLETPLQNKDWSKLRRKI